MRRQAKHGGARKGAGRPAGPLGAKQVSGLRLTAEVIEFLKSDDRLSRNELADHIIRQSRQFRSWAKSRGDGK